MKMNGQLYDPADLPSEKEFAVRFEYEAGWAPEPVWTLWRRENLLLLPGIELRLSNPQPVAMPTELSDWLRLYGLE
jgi:hypothetical protein